MMLTSFMDLQKSNVTPARELLQIGLPIVAGFSALFMVLLSGLAGAGDLTPDARIASLTTENHMLIAIIAVISISVILLALHNRQTMTRGRKTANPLFPQSQ